MTQLTPTIGLEIHAELRTASKMFCGSRNDPSDSNPNANVCPICLGYPGVLPVINVEAVRHVVRVGLAVNGAIAEYTEFDRKNYFYPDIPKGYQISQYKFPLVSGGILSGCSITRIHLEEDTGQSQHEVDGKSMLNFNRAGVPLMELVTDPVLHSGSEAVSFARELQTLLRYLDASDANMERGEMRVEANLSLSADAEKQLGTKVEIKNLNSFRSVERAINYEIERQREVLGSGASVVQETRGWDEVAEETYSQRKKEESHDYRYFPDPDLPKLQLDTSEILDISVMQKQLPELPWQRRNRYENYTYINSDTAEILVARRAVGDFFDAVIAHLAEDDERLHKLAVNYLTSDVLQKIKTGLCNDATLAKREPREYAELMRMIDRDEVSSRGAKNTLISWLEVGGSVRELAKKQGLLQQSDTYVLKSIADEILKENAGVAEQYIEGKESALQYLVGQGMKKSKGSANPKKLADALKHELQKEERS